LYTFTASFDQFDRSTLTAPLTATVAPPLFTSLKISFTSLKSQIVRAALVVLTPRQKPSIMERGSIIDRHH
jgi:hypothetical protein